MKRITVILSLVCKVVFSNQVLDTTVTISSTILASGDTITFRPMNKNYPVNIFRSPKWDACVNDEKKSSILVNIYSKDLTNDGIYSYLIVDTIGQESPYGELISNCSETNQHIKLNNTLRCSSYFRSIIANGNAMVQDSLIFCTKSLNDSTLEFMLSYSNNEASTSINQKNTARTQIKNHILYRNGKIILPVEIEGKNGGVNKYLSK